MNAPTVKPTAFVVAAKKYFGFLPGQTLLDFKNELAKLTPADRAELAPLLSKELNEEVSP